MSHKLNETLYLLSLNAKTPNKRRGRNSSPLNPMNLCLMYLDENPKNKCVSHLSQKEQNSINKCLDGLNFNTSQSVYRTVVGVISNHDGPHGFPGACIITWFRVQAIKSVGSSHLRGSLKPLGSSLPCICYLLPSIMSIRSSTLFFLTITDLRILTFHITTLSPFSSFLLVEWLIIDFNDNKKKYFKALNS